MNKKRTISIQHPQLVRFRNALREVITLAESDEVRKLREQQRDLRPTESDGDMRSMKILNEESNKLERTWRKSLCTCPSCGSRTRDMTFNPNGGYWFCTECYQHHHDYYMKKAAEGEIWQEDGEPSTEWYP